jgi:hypothetical protein
VSAHFHKTWTTEKELHYLRTMGTHRGVRPFSWRRLCLQGYLSALNNYTRRWDAGVDEWRIRQYAETMLRREKERLN